MLSEKIIAAAPPKAGTCRVDRHGIAYLLHNEHLLRARPELQAVVFVHGLSMSVKFWELAMLPEIDRGLPWLSVSLPLHFPSTYDGNPYTANLGVRAYAKTLAKTIERVIGPHRPVIVVGHSVGAMAALAFAGLYPDRCAGVFSIGGFTSGRAKGLEGGLQLLTEGIPFTRPIFNAVWRAKQHSLWATRQIVRQYAADRKALEDFAPFEPTLRIVHPDLARHPIDGIFNMMRSLLYVDVLPVARHITCPVWAIAGTKDPVVDFEHQRGYARALPTASLHAVEGAGHLSFAERPEEFNELLLAFVGLGR